MIKRILQALFLLSVWSLYGCDQLLNRHLGGGIGTSHDPITFIVAGQSNGVSPAQGDFTSVFSVTGRVSIVHNGVFNGTPTANNPDSFDVAWIYLGDSLAGSLNQPIQFVNVARGNTSTQQWVDNEWFKDIAEAARTYNACAVLWVQGESDANAGIINTQHTMEIIIRGSQVYNPNLKFYMALDGWFDPGVHLYQQNVINEGLALAGPDIDSMRAQYGSAWFERTRAEFQNIAGLQGHAKAWFDILMAQQPWRN